MSHESQIRLYEQDRELLRTLKQSDYIIHRAKERGVIPDHATREDLSFDELIRTLIPDDADELSNAEDTDVRLWVRSHGAKRRVEQVAGRGVTQRRAILTYAARFLDDELGEVPSWALENSPSPDDIDDLSNRLDEHATADDDDTTDD